jgi:hypothetical protein
VAFIPRRAASHNGRWAVIGAALAIAALLALVSLGGGAPSSAQAPSFCPPTFEASGSSDFDPHFLTGKATRSGKAEDVRLEARYGATCKPSITATAFRGDAARVVLPFTAQTPATARAFRLDATNLCTVSVSRALRVVGRASRHSCEQALLAFYVGPTPSPKEGTAVRADSCRIVGISRTDSALTKRAHRDTIPVTVEVDRIGGQEGILFGDDIIIKISDPSVGTPYVAAPANAAQLKECDGRS